MNICDIQNIKEDFNIKNIDFNGIVENQCKKCRDIIRKNKIIKENGWGYWLMEDTDYDSENESYNYEFNEDDEWDFDIDGNILCNGRRIKNGLNKQKN